MNEAHCTQPSPHLGYSQSLQKLNRKLEAIIRPSVLTWDLQVFRPAIPTPRASVLRNLNLRKWEIPKALAFNQYSLV